MTIEQCPDRLALTPFKPKLKRILRRGKRFGRSDRNALPFECTDRSITICGQAGRFCYQPGDGHVGFLLY